MGITVAPSLYSVRLTEEIQSGARHSASRVERPRSAPAIISVLLGTHVPDLIRHSGAPGHTAREVHSGEALAPMLEQGLRARARLPSSELSTDVFPEHGLGHRPSMARRASSHLTHGSPFAGQQTACSLRALSGLPSVLTEHCQGLAATTVSHCPRPTCPAKPPTFCTRQAQHSQPVLSFLSLCRCHGLTPDGTVEHPSSPFPR